MNNTDYIAEEAINIGLNELRAEIDDMIRPSQEEVREKGKIFLKAYEKAQKEYSKNLNKQNKNRSRTLKQQIELQFARKAFDDFQNAINTFYGQLVKIMYVYMDPKTGQITLSVHDNTTSLLSINKNYGNVQYQLQKLNNIFQLEDYDSSLLDAAEQSIYMRWNIAKSKTKRNRMLPILWKYNGQWEGAKINNLGTISEAYVNFYLSKYEFKKYLEENVRDYILNPVYGAAAVDNMSGFLIGDSSILDGKIQFAVKKETASPMNMKKVYDITKTIINSPDFIKLMGEEFIEKEKQKAKKNQVKKILENNIERTYENLIFDYLK